MKRLGSLLGIQFAVLTLLGFMPLLAYLLVTLPDSRREALDHQAEAVQLTLTAIKRDAATILDMARGTLQMLTLYPAVQSGDWQGCRRIVETVKAQFPRYAFVGVVAADGSVTCPSSPVPPGTTVRDRLWFRQAMATRAFGVGEYAVGRGSGRPSLHLAAPVLRDGAVVGAANVALDAEWLAHRLAEFRAGPHTVAYALDAAGTVLASQPPRPERVGSPISDAAAVAAMAERGAGVLHTTALDGVPRKVDFLTVPEGASAGRMVLAIGTDEAAVVAAAQAGFSDGVTVWTVAALGSIGLLWLGLGWQVIRPVRSLADAVRQFRDGKPLTPMRRPLLRNEIDLLADALGEAVVALQEKERQSLALARRDVLLREVVHRVKNHLASLAAMLQIETLRFVGSPAEAPMQAMQRRVAALGDLYGMLADSSDVETVALVPYVERIVASLESFGTQQGDGVAFRKNIRGRAAVSVEQAVSVGILVNEVVTNALKHAFPDGKGEIAIDLDASDEAAIRLRIGDDGKGSQPNGGRAGSLGLTIINAMIRQLNAAADVRHDGGTSYSLTFAADGRAEDQWAAA